MYSHTASGLFIAYLFFHKPINKMYKKSFCVLLSFYIK